MDIYGIRIKNQMSKHGITFEQLAEKTKLSENTLYAYATGKRILKVGDLLKLTKALKCTPEYLMGIDHD